MVDFAQKGRRRFLGKGTMLGLAGAGDRLANCEAAKCAIYHNQARYRSKNTGTCGPGRLIDWQK
jgi:hypothetical protein